MLKSLRMSIANFIAPAALHASKSGWADSSLFDDWMPGYAGLDYRNADLTYSEHGAAQAEQLLVDIGVAVDYWEQFLDGVTWHIKDNSSGETLITTDERNYPLTEPGGVWFNAVKRFRMQFRHSYWKSIARSDWVIGETYLYVAQTRNRQPNALQWLNPLHTEPDIIDGVIDGYNYYADDSRRVGYHLDPDTVAYRMMRRNMFNDLRGASSVLRIIDEANLSRNVKRAFRQYFRNGMILGGVVSPDGDMTLTKGETQVVERYLRNEVGGTRNAHTWAILPRKMVVEQFQAKDASQDLASIELLSRYMSKALRVPEVLVNPADATYQNMDAARRAWYQMSGIPYAKDIATYHNTQLLPMIEPGSNCYIEPDLAPYEIEDPAIVSQDVNAGYIDINTARRKRGYSPDNDLSDVYIVNGRPMSKRVLIQMAQMLPGEELVEYAQASDIEQSSGVNNVTGVALSSERNAPPQTTFSEVTYNGVTVQASPVQPSSRDDKKFMRWVRYDGSERLVHWGQPGEQMERDNPESREAFESRHSCSQKKDPFAAGFWACWAWQPNAEVRSKNTRIDDMTAELFRWQSYAKKRIKSGRPDVAAEFESDILPALLHSQVAGMLSVTRDLESVEPIFDDAFCWTNDYA